MPQGFWDQFSRTAPQAFDQSAALYARRKQEEEQRKYREEQQAETRKYYADQERKRKAEQRKYTEGLKVQTVELKEQSRIKAVAPVAESAAQYYAPLVQQGLMTEQDVQLQIQHIMTQSGGDSAYDTMIAAGKRFEPAKPKAPAKPTADEKFNYVMKAYFAGQGEQLSPAQWKTLRQAMPAGMKDIPLTPPEGVTSVGTLRTYMKQEKKQRGVAKKQQEVIAQIEEAKIAYKADLTEYGGSATRPGSFQEWMREPNQIRKYGSVYAALKKQQVEAQRQRFLQPATAMPQGMSQGAPEQQQERMATQQQISAIQQLEEQMKALEASLR